jgi:type VI secretion system protein ImpF
MAAPKNDRLAPPLMHAFRAAHAARDANLEVDIRDRGERVIAPRRQMARTPISERELRRLVDSDLVALLNTTNLDSAEDLSPAPEVRRSILNFGFPDLARRTIDEGGVFDIAREIETALADFEPRLVRNSIKARRDTSVEPEQLRVRFLVNAELRIEPVNLPVEFIAEVEVESGRIKVDRLQA